MCPEFWVHIKASGFFTPNEKIDFSGVKIEPLLEDQVDFETFSKSDFKRHPRLLRAGRADRKTLIAITNLPPRPMMGIESCGMLLSAVNERNGEEELHLLVVDNHIPAGAKLY